MSNMKLKRVFALISAITICIVFIGVSGGLNVKSANAADDKTAFSTEITATFNAHGQTVSILPEEVRLLNERESFDADYLNGLYEYSTLHKQFQRSVGDNAKVVEIYRAADAFKPINNVLKWNSSLSGVTSYKVRVAYDNKFTKCVLIDENADIDAGVTLENPLVDTTYFWQVIATMENGDKVYSPIFDFTTADTLRTVSIDGVSNSRDIGGAETAYGYVRQGLVYRSARLESITADGIVTFKQKLGIKTELDLRGAEEIDNYGFNQRNAAGVDEENCFVYATPQYAAYLTGKWQEEDVSDVNILGINGEVNFESVKNIMTVFTDKDNYPIDFHCSIGRDRTGTIAALLKGVLGFSESDIVNDYFTSMFSTTGAWDKDYTKSSKENFMMLLAYLKSFDGDTLAEKTANYLINKCGMTEAEITAIRDIMTGKVEVKIPADNTKTDDDNYADCCFVTFEKFGTAKEVKVVKLGEKVASPYNIGEDYYWALGGAEYDFTASVNNDLTIKALKKNTCRVKIVASGDADYRETTVTVNYGAAFDFSTLQKAGYNFTVVSGDGRVITQMTVVENTTINVVYRRV